MFEADSRGVSLLTGSLPLPVEIISNLAKATDDVRARFAEMFDLHAIIRPDGLPDGYHIDLTANIPLEMEGDKPGAYDMVFRSSGCLCSDMYGCLIPFSVSISRDI